MTKYMALAVIVALAPLTPAQGDWIRDMTSDYCSPNSRDRIADSVRHQIESSVQRSEGSINPPVPVSDLGCLDGLMNMNIDSFASVGTLGELFSGSLDGIVNFGEGQARQFCSLAKQRWNEASQPLNIALGDLQGGAVPKFMERFGLSNFPQELIKNPHGAERNSSSKSGRPEESRNGRRADQTGSGQYRSAGQASNLDAARRTEADAGGAFTIEQLVDEIWQSLYGKGE